jgi:K+-sensing histidine kinase KdpD
VTRLPDSSPLRPHPGALEARFLAVVSHELRTPLTTIASFTESLDTVDLPPSERSLALSAVRRNTERMLTLVDDLMVVSRLQTGDLTLALTKVDPAELVQEAADSLAVHEPHTAISVDAVDGPPIMADSALLCQLFYAVIGTVSSGAVDRSATVTTVGRPAGWTITVTAQQSEQLTDESLMAGMLAMPQPPHRRRSTALWMLLADAIATRHGGSIELMFDAATGAGAVIRLPVRPVPHA